MKYVVHLDYDHDPINPCDWGEWEVISFNTNHTSFKHPDTVMPPDVGLRSKLRAGTAYILSYYEHGDSAWMLADSPEWAATPDKQWDGRAVAGLLLWHGKPNEIGKTPELRREHASGFIDSYTKWCNGHVYAYHIEKVVGCEACGTDHREDLDDATCSGFEDSEQMFEEIRAITADADEVEIEGPAKWLADYDDIKEKAAAA